MESDKNIYQNASQIAILSMSRFDEDTYTGRRTQQFVPAPSQMANSQTSLTSQQRTSRRGFYDFLIAILIVTCLCLILGVVIPILKNNDSDESSPSLPLSSINVPLTPLPSPSPSVNDVSPDGVKEPITLNDILLGNLTPKTFNGSWNLQNIIYYDETNNLCSLNVNTLEKKIIIDNTIVKWYSLHGDLLSKDLNFLLSDYGSRKIHRYSNAANYKIYDIQNNVTIDLLPNASLPDDRLIQYIEWGPLLNESQIFFVHDNDIYYMPNPSLKPIRLTFTGVINVIYNGITDWVYEEEILFDIKALWISPDGQKLAYASTDDSNVDVMTWSEYGDYHDPNNQYPSMVKLRYPKPGRTNPIVKIYVIDLNTFETYRLLPPKSISMGDYYFTAVKWINSTQLTIVWLSRNQTFSMIDVCDALDNWRCTTSFTLESRHGWIEFNEAPLTSMNLDAYFIRVPHLYKSPGESYEHVAMVNLTTFNVSYLTFGPYDVIELLALNENTKRVYFLSSFYDDPKQRHLMSASITDELNPNPECHTCNLTKSCKYISATFSSNATFYVLQCQGPDLPKIEIRRTDNNELIIPWELNQKLKDRLSKKALPNVRDMKVKIIDDFYAYVMLILPVNFNESAKYPLIVEVYGGPNSQTVKDSYWIGHGSSFLTANQSIVYAKMDVRGSANQGLKYLHQIYLKLGQIEVNDIITVGRYLSENLTYIDGTKVAIWGWSYGGYATLMSLVMDYNNPVYKCGIAVAPVTNWLYYDSVYVERYMGLPSDNPIGYNQSNVIDKLVMLKNKKLLLAFGTADDNVHAQHSMMLMKALNELEINYETQIYPDNDHSLEGNIHHLHNKMHQFLRRCFADDK